MHKLDRNRLLADLHILITLNQSDTADYIVSVLKGVGLKPKKDKYGNVIATVGKGEGFLLNAHIDTVNGGCVKPFVMNGRMYGRGSSDNNSGVATLLWIARNINDIPLKRKFIFLFSINEEQGDIKKNGVFLSLKNIDATGGIVLEPTFKGKTLRVGVGCKGTFQYHITAFGKSCHSGSPQKGVNPIYLANDFINEANENLSITQIKAEEGINVIPSRCTIGIDYRAMPYEKSEGIKKIILALCKKHFLNGFELKENCINGYFGFDKNMADIIRKTAKKKGYRCKFIMKNGRNDCAIFSNFTKIKTICFGTGESGEGHTANESVSIKGFLDCSEILYSIVEQYCVEGKRCQK